MRWRLAVALGAALTGGYEQAAKAQTARLDSAYTWRIDSPVFGGFSGIELSDDGAHFTAISDRGHIIQGQITRQNGRITALAAGPLHPLLGPNGQVPSGKWRDAEGLAIAVDGTIYISFEGIHRLWKYTRPTSPAIHLPRPDAFKSMQSNSSLEALAIDRQGWLYTLPERSGQTTRPFPVFRFDGKKWTQPFDISRSQGFLPVGADFGPDGWLYLLERGFSGFGFQSRVRRFDVSTGQIRAEQTLLHTPIRLHDNLEGLAVWRDQQGKIRLTMISDDNFRALQSTQIVEYIVAEPLAN